MNIIDVISYNLASFNLVYKLPDDGTDVPKHVTVGKWYTDVFILRTFCSVYDYVLLGLIMYCLV